MKNESIDKILEELEKARQFLVKFQGTGKMPDIERDIVLAKFRNMYEFLQLIQLEEIENSGIDAKLLDSTLVKESSAMHEETPTKTIEFEEEVEKEAVSIVEKSPVIEQDKPKPNEVHAVPIDAKLHSTGKTEILAEKFQSGSFLHDALSQLQNVSDLSKKMQNQPIKDIFSAINLNDKFLLIKKLFNNDTALYQSTVEKLNAAGNFNDAVRYLDGNFTWDFTDPMVQNFLELVRRRFL
jgi:hypothetical protein